LVDLMSIGIADKSMAEDVAEGKVWPKY
jgi:hypothetical protein